MTMQEDTNPRAVPGDNSAVDYGRIMLVELERDYKGAKDDTGALLIEAKGIVDAMPVPRTIRDEELAGKVATLFKRIRDHAKSLTAFHAKEKLPHKVRGETCDSFFFGQIDLLARRDKKNKAGAADVLFLLYDEYQQHKLRVEQLERLRAADEAAAAEAAAAKAAAEAARVEEEARLAAERARAPAQIEKKVDIAEAAAVAADSAKVDHMMATDKADAAELATKSKPADMVRERYDGGVMGTMGTVPFVEITSKDDLDLEKLRPFLKLEWLETALRGYAGSVSYSQDAAHQIKGAKFGKKPKSAIR